jgi:hypothetical protein
MGASDTIIHVNFDKLVSCRKCYKTWQYRYAVAKKPHNGTIELNSQEELAFMKMQYAEQFRGNE